MTPRYMAKRHTRLTQSGLGKGKQSIGAHQPRIQVSGESTYDLLTQTVAEEWMLLNTTDSCAHSGCAGHRLEPERCTRAMSNNLDGCRR